MDVEGDRSTRTVVIGPHLAAARLERRLSQAELATRCGLSQAQVSYFELDRRRPTIDQLVRLAGALDVSLHRLIVGSDRPGGDLRDLAVELRRLGLVDLWVADPIVPGAFRRPEEVIALAVSGDAPAPRVIEAVPALLAWNRLNPVLQRAYGRTAGPRILRRLAWLADVALAIDRRRGFPGGCRSEQLSRFARKVPAPAPGSDDWDDLGRPMEGVPKSPVWKRWRINYEADLERFEQRARDLDQTVKSSGVRRRRRGGIAERTDGEASGGT
ncbi:helix-turn-helix domain-containing protein [Paludisphaera rhizosphaerae]|uniref:helix-turn-helix domain-containing protein n=1 Tax=Paludisphaera rhizosphaerae TaxID=2711216 RepID=UPI0013EA8262|nr:helix-turn-helix transcriptional regulator [Paludisphaera rhizosphaerae]